MDNKPGAQTVPRSAASHTKKMRLLADPVCTTRATCMLEESHMVSPLRVVQVKSFRHTICVCLQGHQRSCMQSVTISRSVVN